MYDPVIGRFPSVDPIIEEFPYLTPYNYASNSPIWFIDLWGLQGVPNPEWDESWSRVDESKLLENQSAEERARALNLTRKYIVDPILDEIPGVGEVRDLVNGDYLSLGIGLFPFGKQFRRLANYATYYKKIKAGEGILDANGGFRKLEKVNNPDEMADKLAERLGGQSRVKIEGFENEFDVVNDAFIGQTTTRTSSFGSSQRNEAKATFEAAKETGRSVYYEFTGGNLSNENIQKFVNKLKEYSDRFDVSVKITFN